VWEDVNKKAVKGKVPQKGGGYKGGRGDGGGRGYRERGGRGEAGRGLSGRGGGGGRGGGPGRREGRGGRGKERRPEPSVPAQDGTDGTEPVVVAEAEAPPADPLPSGAPAPVVNPPRPTGAWGKPAARAAPAAAPPAAPEVTIEKAAPEPVAMPPPEPKADIKNTSLDIGIVTPQDPTPSGVVSNNGDVSANGGAPKPVGGGNVWATKGSAHLINAEKPKPPEPEPELDQKEAIPESKPKRSRDRRGKRAPQSHQEEPAADIAPITPASDMIVPQGPAEVELEPVAPAAEYIESSIGASVNGSNAWTPSQTEIQASPVGPISVTSSSVPEMSMNLVNEAPAVMVSPEKAAPPSASANVLNMGHWETGDNDESLDFGFGSFGAENDVDEVGAALEAASEAPPAAQPSASPARPPPGLPLSGMPPMPANAVLVHELEGALESASLGPQSDDPNGQSVESSLANKQPLTSNLAPASQMQPYPDMNGTAPQGAMAQNYASAYGMGMYNYNANLAGAANGFPGMAPVLGGGALPPQAKPQQPGGVAPSATLPQQGGLYGAPSSAGAPTVGLAADSTTAPSADGAPAPGIPPGMPAGMPYNPALYYGQQPYQMGQPHGVSGYGYGYGAQFGGAVQGGFGYQQVMGQSGGYGQPYEEQPSQQHPNSHHNSHHSGGGNHQGGYQKNNHSGGGGYRGRNNNNQYNNHHHNNQSQYQGQYNNQHQAGYGQQAYGMGYGVDHFNQRGGYGPNNMDPYSMQQQNSAGYQSSGVGGAGGFNGQEDSDQQPHQGKGKGKGGNSRGFGSNPNMQQFQQGPPQAQQGGAGQQSFGLQGGVGDSTSAPAAGTGAGAGAGGTNSGWSNQSWGGAGWQGNN
jgi:hypothetical protein